VGLPFPQIYCRDVYNYNSDKPSDYGDEAVYIPNGVYFTEVERERYKMALKSNLID